MFKLFKSVKELTEYKTESEERIDELEQKVYELERSLDIQSKAICKEHERIDSHDGLFTEKHEMILQERARIDEHDRLFTEKHNMIMEDRARIDEHDRLFTEKHNMIIEDRVRIDNHDALFTEKHEMIMDNRNDISVLSKYAVIGYWSDKEKTKDISEVIDYLRKNEMCMIPYEWTKDYSNMHVDVLQNEDGWRYVDHHGRKMFFPQDYSEQRIIDYYRTILLEQDERSPHRYLTDNFTVDETDILIDCGAAEGFFALDHIDSFKKVYLIECEQKWVEALSRTFAEYKDKVSIIQKFVASFSSEKTVCLKELIKPENKYFIKMDIEGAEIDTLNGIDYSALKAGSKLAICAYHRQDDYESITNILNKKGIKHTAPEGFVLSDWGGYKEPFLRKGVVRAIKI